MVKVKIIGQNWKKKKMTKFNYNILGVVLYFFFFKIQSCGYLTKKYTSFLWEKSIWQNLKRKI